MSLHKHVVVFICSVLGNARNVAMIIIEEFLYKNASSHILTYYYFKHMCNVLVKEFALTLITILAYVM